MAKPRGRGTSAEIKRSAKVSPARARARPAAKAGRVREEQPIAPAKPRARVERAGAERANNGQRRRARALACAPPCEVVEPKPYVDGTPTLVMAPRPPELDWDDAPRSSEQEALAARWAARGEELFQALAAHGVSGHEVRADLNHGRFLWLSPSGRVSAEARAQVLCRWSCATSVVTMAWCDPLVRGAGVDRIDDMPSEQDNVDEEGAWRLAMEAAEACGAAYLYRVPSPLADYFLGLHDLTFSPARSSFNPGAPVGLVLRAIAEVREAIESRAEPAAVVRNRLSVLGNALFHQARYAYRSTDWVARLDRTGACLLHLAKRIPRPSFSSIAAGRWVSDWIERDLAVELIAALHLIEDEWSLFS